MDEPPDTPNSPDFRELIHFHTVLSAVNPQQPVAWEGHPAEFLHYRNPLSTHPLHRPPPRSFQELGLEEVRRPGALPALYSALFSSDRRLIPSAPLDGVSLSQFLYDALALVDGDRDLRSGFLPRVPPSSGGFHPTVAHVITPAVPGLVCTPCAVHYSPEDHALEARAVLDPGFFSEVIPNGALVVGLSTDYSREVWRHGERGFRYCHLNVGHAVAAVAFAAAVLGWDARLLSKLGQRDLEKLMGWAAALRGTGLEQQDPVCALLVFPNTLRSFCVDYGILSSSIMRHLGPLTRGRSLAVFRTADPCLFLVPGNRFWASKTSPGFHVYGALMVREVVRSRQSVALMDPSYHMETEVFYQLLLHCLPSGQVTPRQAHRQGAFPFVVLPWKSRIDAFIIVHRVKALAQGLYCLVRNHDHFNLLKSKTPLSFHWQLEEKWSWMGLPLYRLLPANLEEKVVEIAFRQPVALNSCFVVMMVGPLGDVMDMGLSAYPLLFWEAGVLGHLLSLDAQAVGLTACGISSFFDDMARSLLTPDSSFFQTLYLYSVGKQLPEQS